jgi:ABC-type glutathione transport system ATPase component
MKVHQEECIFRTVTCGCEKTILHKDLKLHTDSWCQFAQDLETLQVNAMETIAIATERSEDLEQQREISKIAAEIARPTLLAIVGESNSGKTSLINKLLNFPLLPINQTLVPCVTRYSAKNMYFSTKSMTFCNPFCN